MGSILKTGFVVIALSSVSGALASAAFAGNAPKRSCKPLQYESYFVANNVKGNIKRVNSDLDHPNFAGHYLLLRAELALETIYLIADCDTGEFLHEKLTSDRISFTQDQSLVVSEDTKTNERSRYSWDGKTWEKLADSAPPPSPTATATPLSNAKEKTTEVAMPTSDPAAGAMIVNTVPAPLANPAPCHALDFGSYFRASENQKAIQKANPDLTHANFYDHYIIVKYETLFDKMNLIANCENGKFFSELISGELNFTSKSPLVTQKFSGEKRNTLVWANEEWLTTGPKQKNTLHTRFASLLFHTQANGKKVDTIRFENLNRTKELETIFKALEIEKIVSGHCQKTQQKSAVCDIES